MQNRLDHDPIVSRPGLALWIAEVLFGMMTACFWEIPYDNKHPFTPTGTLVSHILSALFVLGGFLYAYWLRHASVIADERGLRWRSLGRWRSCRWEQVTDYYLKVERKRGPSLLVVTEIDKLRLEREWTHHREMRDRIQKHATMAIADEWNFIGARKKDEWPITYIYTPKATHDLLRTIKLFKIFLAIGVFGITYILTESYHMMGLGCTLGVCSLISMYLLIPLASYDVALARLKDMRERKDQCITVDDEGLTYEDRSRSLHVKWEDITDYYRVKFGKRITSNSRCVIESIHGQVNFTINLSDYHILMSTITSKVPGRCNGKWRVLQEDEFRAYGVDNNGTRLYGYRTRSNRAMLWFIWVWPLAMGLSVILTRAGLTKEENCLPLALMACTLAVPCSYLTWRYKVGGISINDQGIRQGNKHIAWTDIERFYITGSDIAAFINTTSGTTNIRIWSHIAGSDELLAEIQRRAVNASNER